MCATAAAAVAAAAAAAAAVKDSFGNGKWKGGSCVQQQLLLLLLLLRSEFPKTRAVARISNKSHIAKNLPVLGHKLNRGLSLYFYVAMNDTHVFL